MRTVTRRARLGTLAAAGLAAAALTAAGTLTAARAGSLPPTWHVHDCAAAPCTWPHAGVAFFPQILGESLSTYLADPAQCPDATDKAFLGGGMPGPTGDGLTGNQPLREGVCMTSDTVIHLKSIAADQPAPDGWTLVSTAAGFSTYSMLTSR